jgi:Protein of unknown function (DUF3025)
MRFFQPVVKQLIASNDWVGNANALLRERADRSGQCLVSGGGQALVFRQGLLDETLAYEPGIFETGQVPCRTVEGGFSLVQERHDFYNALVWLMFPKSKARLNQLSMHALDALKADKSQRADQATGNHVSSAAHRGPLRDAITVFDENALLLLCCDSQLTDLLAAMQWHDLLLSRRAQWQGAETIVPVCFGHALLQKLETPYKAITGHSFVLSMTAYQLMASRNDAGLIDAILCEQLTKEVLIAKPFLPLPVLGIPDWSYENQDTKYYDDPQVFRKRKVTLRTV